MKAAFLHDVSINIQTASEAYRKAANPVVSVDGKVTDWVIPQGFVIEGDDALLRVGHGIAAPIDEECARACGMDEGQLRRTQRVYESATKGIRGPHDLQLFMNYVIDGYAPGSTDENTVYIPGEKWQEFQDLKAKAKKEKSI